jgi:hypothetical protein
LWRQGPAAPFFGNASPSFTARVLDGAPDDDRPVVCFGFVIPFDDEKWRPVAIMDGPRPAIVVGMFEGAPGIWQVWGQPPEGEWRLARLVEIPLPPTGPMQ